MSLSFPAHAARGNESGGVNPWQLEQKTSTCWANALSSADISGAVWISAFLESHAESRKTKIAPRRLHKEPIWWQELWYRSLDSSFEEIFLKADLEGWASGNLLLR